MLNRFLFKGNAPSGAFFIVHIQRLLQIILIGLSGISTPALAEKVFQSAESFVSESFAGEPPAAQVLWLTDDIKKQVEKILDHSYDAQRVRYWQRGDRSVWILEEIGKTKPITSGFVIQKQKIEIVKVLVFRESRGWEIKYPFFTAQFNQAGLTSDQSLDRPIDGITGATLSVRALTKLARIALLLDQQIKHS